MAFCGYSIISRALTRTGALRARRGLSESLAVDYDDAEGIPKLNTIWRWEYREQRLSSSCFSKMCPVRAREEAVLKQKATGVGLRRPTEQLRVSYGCKLLNNKFTRSFSSSFALPDTA